MRISVGSDHRGVSVKAKIVEYVQQLGHDVTDEGTNGTDSVDYPDIAACVSEKVSRGQVDRGILVCGTGIGMAIAANKFPRVRATAVQDELTAEMARRHNDVNVLCLSGDLLGERNLDNLLRIWLETEFDGGRHARRLDKITSLEQANSAAGKCG